MKAERIQTQIPELPGWQTQTLLTAERRFRFPSFLDACQFAAGVAERTAEVAEEVAVSVPQIDIHGGELTLRLVAQDPRVLDAEVALIDRLVPVADALSEHGDDCPGTV